MNAEQADKIVDLICDMVRDVVSDALADCNDSYAGMGLFQSQEKLRQALVEDAS